MNIYDCFMYFDEDLLLDIRLNMLNSHVEKFVITEAAYTHSGVKKNLKFDIDKFKKFKDKIKYIIVDKPPKNLLELNKEDHENKRSEKIILNACARENYQREKLLDGLKSASNDDLIIIGDLDEIPTLLGVNFKNINNKIIIFQQKLLCYKLNLLYEDFIWHGSKACKKKHLISPQWLRNVKHKKYSKWRLDLIFSKNKFNDIYYVENGGWHFTYLKSPEELEKKLLNFLHHHEFEKSGLSLNDLKRFIKEKRIVYDYKADQRGYKWSGNTKLKTITDKELPEYIYLNKSKYSNWLD